MSPAWWPPPSSCSSSPASFSTSISSAASPTSAPSSTPKVRLFLTSALSLFLPVISYLYNSIVYAFDHDGMHNLLQNKYHLYICMKKKLGWKTSR
uniref:Uncharacterized protein n=1 Tax=Setaria viridis TaxID=4556 RepID=A0A4V6DC08_SETVI|nr:hypothetical protein SEVIR_2G389920v2 [Setaria viridis]